MQRFGNFECFDRPGNAVRVVLRRQQPFVEQHADGLNRIQRHAFRAIENLAPHLISETRYEAVKHLAHHIGR